MIREIAKRFLGHESSTTECNEVVRKFGGNASDHICRECCEVSLIDPHKEKLLCESCGSVNVEETCTLGGKQCIKCDGLFSEGEPGAIS
jgi:ribosomal protein S27AE